MPEDNVTPVLLVQAGPGAGRVLPLSGDRIVLGRDPSCGFPFDAAGVSREHCAFIHDEAGWSIRDLGSRNGTRLNGNPLKSEDVILSEGDRVLCGTVELEYGLDRGGADRVRVVQGPLAGRALPLRGALVILGRAEPDADLSLEDHAASRQNTELRFADGIWTVRDLDSRNGTDYDGARIPPDLPLRLHSGARLRIGSTTLDFLDRRVEDLANHELFGYHLEERVAAGPGSVIYRGRSEDGTAVALKLLDPNRTGDSTQIARFIAAGRAQTRWQHPNLVPTLGAGRNDELATVMSTWVSGGCLATRLAGGKPLPIDVVLGWAIDSANGLRAIADQAHGHRGLRPANCLIGDAGQVLISDAATATPYDCENPHGPVPPHYIAPEELDGSDPTPVGNQFSLGCIIHHALSGRAPFGSPDRERVAKARADEHLAAIEGLPPDWTKVLARMLARDPSDRYPSWEEVSTDLEALRRGVAPSTGLLPSGRSTLAATGVPGASSRSATVGGDRSSTRLLARPNPGEQTETAAHHRDPERIVIHPWAIRGAIIFFIVLIIIGFVLPAINRENRTTDTPTPTPARP